MKNKKKRLYLYEFIWLNSNYSNKCDS